MTCIEKLKELHPEWDDQQIRKHVGNYCPTSLFIMPKPIHCASFGWEDSEDEDCEKCWNRKVFDDEENNRYNPSLALTGADMRRIDRLAERIGKTKSDVIGAALKLYEDGLDAVDRSWERYSSMLMEVAK